MTKFFLRFGLLLAVSTTFLACGRADEEPSSDLQIDQALALDATRIERFRQFYVRIMPLIEQSRQGEAHTTLSPTEAMPFQFRPNEAAAINNAFSNGFRIVCLQQKCRGSGVGKAVETSLAKEKEVDRIAFDKSVRILFRYEVGNHSETIEICKVEGVQLKKSLLWADLDGGRIGYGKGSAGTARAAMMDAGAFGSYPTNGCQ